MALACRKSLFFKNIANSLTLTPNPFPSVKGCVCFVGSASCRAFGHTRPASVPGLSVAATLTPLGATPKARTLWLLAKSFARCKTNIASNAKPPFLITIEVFLQPAAYSSVFDIYFIQRSCLFSVPATFTQDIRKKHSCSE